MAVNKTDTKSTSTPEQQTGHPSGPVEAFKPGTEVSAVTGAKVDDRSPDAPVAAHTQPVIKHIATVTDPNELVEGTDTGGTQKAGKFGEWNGSVYDYAKAKGVTVNQVYRENGMEDLVRKRIDPDTGELVDLDYEA